MSKFLLLLPVVFLLGCSYGREFYSYGPMVTNYLGKVEHRYKKHSIKSISLLGPTINEVITEDMLTGEMIQQPINTAAGTGIGPAIVAGGASVGTGYYIGRGLKHSGDNTTVNQSGASSAESDASSNADIENDVNFIGPKLPKYYKPKPPKHDPKWGH